MPKQFVIVISSDCGSSSYMHKTAIATGTCNKHVVSFTQFDDNNIQKCTPFYMKTFTGGVGDTLMQNNRYFCRIISFF